MVRKLEAARSGGFIGLSQGMRQLPNRAEMTLPSCGVTRELFQWAL
jgi:hypothetical protein